MAVEETGLGRVDDKINKNLLVADKTPGTEILRPIAQSGDDGLMLIERAPYGVIGAITPTTNPTETIICNAIGMIAAGNSVVFNVHPSAKKVCRFLVEKLNDAIMGAGGPEGLIAMMGDPTIESANAMMKHPGVRLVVVTGGPGVVKAAMQSGKRAICGGPGNPPVVVDETADLKKAGKGIVAGCSLDNNIVCIAEKEVFVVDDVADALLKEIEKAGGALMSRADVARLEKVVLDADGHHPHKDWVGKDAAKIARAKAKEGLAFATDEKHRSLLIMAQKRIAQRARQRGEAGVAHLPRTLAAGLDHARAESGDRHTGQRRPHIKGVQQEPALGVRRDHVKADPRKDEREGRA
jgi:acyl-CoA reductase-like NAD-dependent aldehyde dehydrogenase